MDSSPLLRFSHFFAQHKPRWAPPLPQLPLPHGRLLDLRPKSTVQEERMWLVEPALLWPVSCGGGWMEALLSRKGRGYCVTRSSSSFLVGPQSVGNTHSEGSVCSVLALCGARHLISSSELCDLGVSVSILQRGKLRPREVLVTGVISSQYISITELNFRVKPIFTHRLLSTIQVSLRWRCGAKGNLGPQRFSS